MKQMILSKILKRSKVLKFIIIMFFLSSIQVFCSATIDPKALFVGTIKFPNALENSDLCLYYKGEKLKTECDNNNLSVQFSFLESKTSQSLYLLFCDDLTCQKHPKNNTIKSLKITSNNHVCYELHATRIYDDHEVLTSYSWNCCKHTLDQGIVPDNTLIFLFNPKLVEEIQINNWSKNQAMRLIPTIKIRSNATIKDICRAIDLARLKSIDIDIIHSKDSNKIKPVTN